jgi:hypothetical protein
VVVDIINVAGDKIQQLIQLQPIQTLARVLLVGLVQGIRADQHQHGATSTTDQAVAVGIMIRSGARAAGALRSARGVAVVPAAHHQEVAEVVLLVAAVQEHADGTNQVKF